MPSLLNLSRAWLCAAALLALAGGARADICRVKTDGDAAASGIDWDAQATTLRAAIGNASCTEIWVKRGIYAPSSEYVIDRNLVLRGDFAGTETSADDRALPLNPGNTTLDGDGATRLLYIDGTSTAINSSTLIEGFTLTGGNGAGAVGGGVVGGAVYCRADNGHECSPGFSHVVFSANGVVNLSVGTSGGAVHNYAGAGSTSSPSFSDVTFDGNSAKWGGAVENHAIEGVSSPSFRNVTFLRNHASYGGAVANQVSAGVSSPSFDNVTFSGNSATVDGGAVYSDSAAPSAEASAASSPVFTHVTFWGNHADSFGGAIANFSSSTNGIARPVLRNTILWGNTAATGAQVYNEGGASAGAVLTTSILQDTGGCPSSAGFSCDAFTTASGSADPLLGALQDNGGSTFTHLPGAGSPALNQADTTFCLATDQRGVPRPQGAGCDIGAVEVRVAAPPATGGVAAVPTLGEWALALMALLAAGLGAAGLHGGRGRR